MITSIKQIPGFSGYGFAGAVINLQVNNPELFSGDKSPYHGCGKVWAAIDRETGKVLDIIYMSDHGGNAYMQVPDKRYKKGYRWVERDTSKEFSEHRAKSREKLATLGYVVSAECSCYELNIMSHKFQQAGLNA